MTRYTFRPFQFNDADYAFMQRLMAALHPDNSVTVDDLRADDAILNPDFPHHRLIISQDGDDVGLLYFGQHEGMFHPQKYFFDCDVLPLAQTHSLFAAAFAYMCNAVSDQDLIAIQAEAPSTYTTLVDFLTGAGFVITQRNPTSVLALTTVDLAAYQTVEQRINTSGVRLLDLSAVQTLHDDWLQRLVVLENEVHDDVPSPDALTLHTPDSYQSKILAANRFDPHYTLVAVATDGDYVGVGRAYPATDDPTQFHVRFVGVKRSHRRMGIATAIKVELHRRMLAVGGTHVFTDNEANNPMYQLNLALGYQSRAAWLALEKTLKEPTHD